MSSWRKGPEAQKHVETSEICALWCITSNVTLQRERADTIPEWHLLITLMCCINHPKYLFLPQPHLHFLSCTLIVPACIPTVWMKHASTQAITLAKWKYQHYHYQLCVFSLSRISISFLDHSRSLPQNSRNRFRFLPLLPQPFVSCIPIPKCLWHRLNPREGDSYHASVLADILLQSS